MTIDNVKLTILNPIHTQKPPESGEEKNTSLTVGMNTNDTGLYEIMVNASVEDPEYEDWAKVQLRVIEKNLTKVNEELIFTEEYIIGNPKCGDLRELVEQAKDHYEEGEYSKARKKAGNI